MILKKTTTSDPRHEAIWNVLPRPFRYSIGGQRFVEVRRDDRHVVVPLDTLTETEMVALETKKAPSQGPF